MTTFVLVHGGWHTGAHFEDTARPIRAAGHEVHLPTLAGNRPDDDKRTDLTTAVSSLQAYIEAQQLTDFVLVGHSYGGMLITAVADHWPERVRRLVYWNAFVPRDGDCLNDLVPPHYVELFGQLVAPDGGVMLPFPIWREAFINDATLAQAEAAYASLNAHPYATFTEKLSLTRDPAELPMPKSYLNGTGRYRIAGQPRLASAPVGALGPVSPGANARQSRVVFHEPGPPRAGDHGRGSRLTGGSINRR